MKPEDVIKEAEEICKKIGAKDFDHALKILKKQEKDPIPEKE